MSKPQELAALEGQMDIVLIDAPCTGSGTWRRRPDAKWRLTQKQLDVRTGEQKAILDAAKAYVKPGGRLVYITCSVFPAENAGQIDAFLAASRRLRRSITKACGRRIFPAGKTWRGSTKHWESR